MKIRNAVSPDNQEASKARKQGNLSVITIDLNKPEDLQNFSSAEMIPDQCLNILFRFHEKIALVNLQLLMEDEQNSKQYKQTIMDSFKSMKKCWPGFYPDINVLYNAEINLHEFDDRLHEVFKKIRSGILEVKKKSKKVNVNSWNETLFTHMEKYIGYVVFGQLGLEPQPLSYDHNEPLSVNVGWLVNGMLMLIQAYKTEHNVIHCYQAMEQLIQAVESEFRTPNAYNTVMYEIVFAKLHACRLLIYKTGMENNGTREKDINALNLYGSQYVAGAIFLQNFTRYKIKEDTCLIDIFTFLVDYHREKSGSEKARCYLEKGLLFFPDEISLLQRKVIIESQLLDSSSQIVDVITKDDILNRNSISVNQQINDVLCNFKIPVLMDNVSDNKHINSMYEKLKSMHANLTRQLEEIKNYRASITALEDEYQTSLTALLRFPQIDEADFSDNRSEVVHSRLDMIKQYQLDCQKCRNFQNRIELTHQIITNFIEQYKKCLLDINEMETGFNSLIIKVTHPVIRINEINNTTIDILQNASSDTIKAVKDAVQEKMAQKNNANSKFFSKNVFDTAFYLAAYVTTETGFCSGAGLVSEEHKQCLLLEYRNSMFHFYRARPNELIIPGDKVFMAAAGHFLAIFMRSFPMTGPSKAHLIIERMKEGVLAVLNQNKDNQTLTALAGLINRDLDEFDKAYQTVFNSWEEEYPDNTNKESLMKYNRELKELKQNVTRMIPDQCINVLARFHERIAIVNFFLLKEDEANSRQYKNVIIENYKTAMKYSKHSYPDIYLLYSADINLYEIDNELLDTFKKIRSSISTIRNKSNKVNVSSYNVLLFAHIEKYIWQVICLPLGLEPERNPYDHNRPVLVNTGLLINKMLKLIQTKKVSDKVIACYQGIEQLVKAVESEFKTKDTYKTVISEVICVKLHACRELIDKTKTESKGSKEETRQIMDKYCVQYAEGARYLKDFPGYEMTKDACLVDCFIYMIDHFREKGNLEKAESQVKLGLSLLSANIDFLQRKAIIESQVLFSQIIDIKVDDDVINEKLMLAKQQLDEVQCHQKVPVLIDNASHNNCIAEAYKKLRSMHVKLVSQFDNLEKHRKSILSLKSQYQEILTMLEQFSGIYKAVFSENSSEKVHGHLKMIEQYQSDYSKCKNAQYNIILIHQTITNSIEQYKKCLLEFNEMEKNFHLLIVKVDTTAKKNTAIQEERAAKKALRAGEKRKRKILSKILAIQQEQHEKEETKAEANNVPEAAPEIPESVPEAVSEPAPERPAEPLLSDVNNTIVDCDVEKSQIVVSQTEPDVMRDDILLRGAGKPISLSVLDNMSELDAELRANGSHITIKGSWTTRGGIDKFNENPGIASLFIVNDIDIHIDAFDPKLDSNSILNIIERSGFIEDKNRYTNFYRKFTKNLDGMDIDLTLATNRNYCSHEFLILRMGKMQFVNIRSESEKAEAESKGKILVKAGTHYFELILPKGYEDDYINSCKFKELSMLKPHTDFKSYCYSIYKNAVKWSECGAFSKLDFQSRSQPSSEKIFYHELYPHLARYFYDQLQQSGNSCYLELNEFFKKGINPKTTHLASPFISAFYYALIKRNFRLNIQLGDKELQGIANQCANQFILYYQANHDKACTRADRENHILNIASIIMYHYLQSLNYNFPRQTDSPRQQSASQYAYPGTLYNSQRQTKNNAARKQDIKNHDEKSCQNINRYKK